MKYKLLPFFLFFSLILFSQENCTNGIDDDGDGLIDLNDQECLCNNSSITSIIPNPSFEIKTSCPTSHTQLELATPWIQATTGTSDFFHNCGFLFQGMAALGINNFPDGNGAAGVYFAKNYKEYLGTSLTAPMVAGTSYQLTMNVVALNMGGSTASAINPTTLEPANVTVYGCNLGTNLPLDTELSPNTVDPTWIEIGHASYSPVSTWGQITITFTPSININAIIIGAPPVLPPSYPSLSPTTEYLPYFVFDNLLLNTSSSFGVTITSVGSYCDNNLVLSAEITAPLGPGTTYQWYKNGIAIVGATNSTYNVLGNPTSLGSYSVQIINGTNCYLSSNYIINNSIPSPSYTKVDPNCTVATGSITITTPAFQYSFDNGVTWQSSPQKDLLPLGIYFIKIKTLGGCISSTTGVDITEPPLLGISNITVVQPTTCNGLGTITVNSLIATEYSFDNGVTWQTSPTKDLLPVGIYYIKIKTSSGCISSTVEISINQPELLENPIITVVQPTTCNELGTITVNSPIATEYSFDDGQTWQTSPTKDLLPPGIYFIKIKILGGCISSTSSVAITQPQLIGDSNLTVIQPTCNELFGTITVNSTIATEYSFDNGITWQTSPTIDLLPPGIYYIKIKTSTGCISSYVVASINEPQLIELSNLTVIQPTVCNIFGTITVNSTIAAEYSFDDGITWQISPTKDLLTPEVYYIKIKTLDGCISSTFEVSINQPQSLANPEYTVIQPGCGTTGSITITTLASQYSFDNGATFGTSNTLNNIIVGTYLIKFKDASGCISGSSSVTILAAPIIPSAPTVTVAQPANCTASTGTITVTSNALFYSFDNGLTWSNNSTSGQLTPGTYFIKIKNNFSGCPSLSTTAIINAPTGFLLAPSFTIVQPDCTTSTGTITITTLANQYSFDNGLTWSTNPTSLPLNPGNYLLKIKDNTGCESNSSVAVVSPFTNPTPTFNTIPAFCTGTTAPVLPTTSLNGIVGTWSPATVSNTTSGTYTFTPNAGQCVTSTPVQITITVNPLVTPAFDPIPSFCSGTTAPVIPTTSLNGIVGTWSPTTVSNTTSGTYTFTPNAGQCVTSTPVQITITVNPLVTPAFDPIPSFCSGTTAPVLPTTSLNGIVGTWSPSSVSNTTSGTYTFTPNAGQCGAITTISITVNPLVTPTFNAIPAFCAGTTAPVLPTTSLNGIVGTWSPSSVSNTTSGTYTFTPNAGQCVTSTPVQITITVNPSVTPAFDPIPAFCAGTTAPVLTSTSLNGIVGTWSPATVSNTTSGTYTFTPTAGQCVTSTPVQITITVNPLVTPAFDPIPSFCAGTTAPVLPTTSLNGIVGTWSPANVSNTTSGTYTFTPNAGQCVTSTPVQLVTTINPSSLTDFQWIVSEPFSSNPTITIIPNSSGNYLYQLDSGTPQTSNVFYNVSSGLHTVQVTDINGCSDTIVKNDILIIDYPRFFTPNADGYNDTWNINDLFLQKNSKIYIYDRYGKLLKQIFPFQSGWDGKYNNNDMFSDDYWFVVEFEYNNTMKLFKSHFTLKR
jgi:gliding motility-associated-like protein